MQLKENVKLQFSKCISVSISNICLPQSQEFIKLIKVSKHYTGICRIEFRLK